MSELSSVPTGSDVASRRTRWENCVLLATGVAVDPVHFYVGMPNALLLDGKMMAAGGFEYKSNLVWHKIRQDGSSDGHGVGFYFRKVTKLCLFGVRSKNAWTFAPGWQQVNPREMRKREHSRKPDDFYDLGEACNSELCLETFARGERKGWIACGNQAGDNEIGWNAYALNLQRKYAIE